jgi:hypothetical protein
MELTMLKLEPPHRPSSTASTRFLLNATAIHINGHSYRIRRYDASQQAKGLNYAKTCASA